MFLLEIFWSRIRRSCLPLSASKASPQREKNLPPTGQYIDKSTPFRTGVPGIFYLPARLNFPKARLFASIAYLIPSQAFTQIPRIKKVVSSRTEWRPEKRTFQVCETCSAGFLLKRNPCAPRDPERHCNSAILPWFTPLGVLRSCSGLWESHQDGFKCTTVPRGHFLKCKTTPVLGIHLSNSMFNINSGFQVTENLVISELSPPVKGFPLISPFLWLLLRLIQRENAGSTLHWSPAHLNHHLHL